MPEYWLRTQADHADHGPYRGSQLKAMAAAGSIQPDWLISQDRNSWHPARQVKGLFPSSSGGAVAVAAPPASRLPKPLPAASAPVAADPFPADQEAEVPPLTPVPIAPSGGSVGSVAYFTPGTPNLAGAVMPPATLVTVFYCIAAVLFLSWAGIIAAIFAHQPWVALAGAAGLILSDLAGAAIWLTWVYKAHVAARVVSGGAHAITPGTAVGFSFIPVFSGFWVVYMPAKLAGQLNRAASRRLVPVGAIITLQVASVVCALFLPGLIGIFYAISMGLIQKGFKRLQAA